MLEMSALVGIVVALTETLKQLEIIPGKYIPLVSLFIGIALCMFAAPGNFQKAVFEGIIVGLTASGLYSSGKNVMQGLKAPK